MTTGSTGLAVVSQTPNHKRIQYSIIWAPVYGPKEVMAIVAPPPSRQRAKLRETDDFSVCFTPDSL